MVNKKWITMIIGLLVVPLVLAASTQNPKPALDLYYLIVDMIFGNVLVAGIGLTAIWALICVVGKSTSTMFFVLSAWFIVFGIWVLGALGATIIFLLGLIYFYYAWRFL